MTDGAGLVETLRAFADDRLAELFRARPDALNPVPSGFDQLASRMCSPGSLARALDTLDHRGLAVAEAIVVAPVPVGIDAVRDLLGLDEHTVGEVDRLRTLGLVWGPDEALQVPDGLGELFGRHPGGLGPPVAQALQAYPRPRLERLADDLELSVQNGTDPHTALTDTLTDPARVRTLLDDAGPEACAAAERLAGDSPVGTLAEATREVDVASARSPAEQLLARGLFVATDDEHVVLPREVGLVLREGRLRSPDTLAPPELTGPTHDPVHVDSSAAGTAMEVVRLVERLLEAWSTDPAGVLRTGGLGVRELRRVAKLLDTDEDTAALLLECVGESGLVGVSAETAWLPTSGYDTWRRLDPADRWTQLVRAWFSTARAPGMVGTRDERGRIRAALTPELDRAAAPRVRRLALRALAEAPAGTAVDPTRVRAHLSWAAPRLGARAMDELLRQVLWEAATLGVTGLGALAAPGRALLEGATAAEVTDALRPSLPDPVDHVLLQADLTAVAPGPLQPELARELAQVAEAESHGGATVYRFTERSVRHAFDQGQTAAEVHDLLTRCSATPVPQPLSYLVDDVARRHGQLRAGSATAYLRCDDEAALSALVADRRASDLRLRHIAPTVVVSASPVRALVEELRELGYAPVAEGPDGTIAISAPRAQRAEEPRRRRRVFEPAPPEPDVLAAAIRAVRTGDRARANRPTTLPVTQLPRTASTQAVEALRAALSEGQTMWMGYVDQHGGTSDRIVDPVRIEGGWLTAYDHASGEPRSFALHRITGVRQLDSA